MNRIAEALERHGNAWTLQTNNELQELYEPLHAARVSSFERLVEYEKGIKYGPSDRHRLDIYSPISKQSSRRLPVVVFFHGGGFVSGDNDITPSMHGHIGNYFASNNVICVLATYRLLPEACFPSGAEDVTIALQYVEGNIKNHKGDPENIFAVGQSAGAAHLASAIFRGNLKAAEIYLRGSILLSAPLWYDLRQERRRKNMFVYHGTESEEEVLSNAGVSSFRDAASEALSYDNILLMLAQFDSDEIVNGNLMFADEYRKKFSRLPLLEVLKSHNHISYFLGIGLEGDVLGKRILEFISCNGVHGRNNCLVAKKGPRVG